MVQRVQTISSGFTPGAGSFILEAKHNEPGYNRNRFYAGTAIFASNPFGFDNGYFTNGVLALRRFFGMALSSYQR
jgi:hypothetical protein